MKKLLGTLATISLMAVATGAHAISLSIGGTTYDPLATCGDPACIEFVELTDTSQTGLTTYMATNYSTLDELYKSDVDDGVEGGSFLGHYETTYASPGLEGDGVSQFTITHTGGSAIDCLTEACFISVKDGNATPTWYLIDISGVWNGTDTIVGTNFWGGTGLDVQGAISNVIIWGGENQVPAPAPLALLALGLAGITLRRMRKQA